MSPISSSFISCMSGPRLQYMQSYFLCKPVLARPCSTTSDSLLPSSWVACSLLVLVLAGPFYLIDTSVLWHAATCLDPGKVQIFWIFIVWCWFWLFSRAVSSWIDSERYIEIKTVLYSFSLATNKNFKLIKGVSISASTFMSLVGA
jgi:hypothetical protein